MVRICLAGATGWVGRGLVPAIAAAPDLKLVAAVSRTQAGRPLHEALAAPAPELRLGGSVAEALATPCDVLIDYTSPEAVLGNVLSAIGRGVACVIGTSGLTDGEYAEIDAAARGRGVGVLAAGNFAITAVLLQRFAEIAARLVPHWEVIDYARATKPDAPSGTARELAARLARVRPPVVAVPVGQTRGVAEARGATVAGSQLHSVRLPGFVSSIEVLFGLPDERLSIRHDSGAGAEPYVAGTLFAVRKVGGFVGLRRGLDSIMNSEARPSNQRAGADLHHRAEPKREGPEDLAVVRLGHRERERRAVGRAGEPRGVTVTLACRPSELAHVAAGSVEPSARVERQRPIDRSLSAEPLERPAGICDRQERPLAAPRALGDLRQAGAGGGALAGGDGQENGGQGHAAGGKLWAGHRCPPVTSAILRPWEGRGGRKR